MRLLYSEEDLKANIYMGRVRELDGKVKELNRGC